MGWDYDFHTRYNFKLNFRKNILFQMMLQGFLENLILENAKVYFAEHTIHRLRAMNIFSITLIRLLRLIAIMIKFCLCGILTQKYGNNEIWESFLYMHEPCNLVKEETCFKNMQNPSCIDLLLTNNVYAFQQTVTICTGLSNYHPSKHSTLIQR